jgi:hypothetical protein
LSRRVEAAACKTLGVLHFLNFNVLRRHVKTPSIAARSDAWPGLPMFKTLPSAARRRDIFALRLQSRVSQGVCARGDESAHHGYLGRPAAKSRWLVMH